MGGSRRIGSCGWASLAAFAGKVIASADLHCAGSRGRTKVSARRYLRRRENIQPWEDRYETPADTHACCHCPELAASRRRTGALSDARPRSIESGTEGLCRELAEAAT